MQRRAAAGLIAWVGLLIPQMARLVWGADNRRVLLASALLEALCLLLLDEPSSNLDYGNQLRLIELLGQLRDDGRGVLFTTHHPDHAFVVASRVILMRAGRFIAQGSPAQCIDQDQLARLYGLPPDRLARAVQAQCWSLTGTAS